MLIGILHMRGVAGYPGWFWLFVIMGGFTIASGICLGFCLPDSIHNPCTLFLPRHQIFSDRELYILQSRVKIDDPQKSNRKQHIGIEAFKKAVSFSFLGSEKETKDHKKRYADKSTIVHELAHLGSCHDHNGKQWPIPRLRYIWTYYHSKLRVCLLDQ